MTFGLFHQQEFIRDLTVELLSVLRSYPVCQYPFQNLTNYSRNCNRDRVRSAFNSCKASIIFIVMRSYGRRPLANQRPFEIRIACTHPAPHSYRGRLPITASRVLDPCRRWMDLAFPLFSLSIYWSDHDLLGLYSHKFCASMCCNKCKTVLNRLTFTFVVFKETKRTSTFGC